MGLREHRQALERQWKTQKVVEIPLLARDPACLEIDLRWYRWGVGGPEMNDQVKDGRYANKEDFMNANCTI